MKCPNLKCSCKKFLPTDANFCPECGAQLRSGKFVFVPEIQVTRPTLPLKGTRKQLIQRVYNHSAQFVVNNDIRPVLSLNNDILSSQQITCLEKIREALTSYLKETQNIPTLLNKNEQIQFASNCIHAVIHKSKGWDLYCRQYITDKTKHIWEEIKEFDNVSLSDFINVIDKKLSNIESI